MAWTYIVNTGYITIDHSTKRSTTDVILKSPTQSKDSEGGDLIKPTERCVRESYLSYVGVVEEGGNNRGSHIKKFLNYTGLDEGYAWCSAFVCYVLGECDIDNPKSAWTPTIGSHKSGETIYIKNKGQAFPNEVGENNMVFTLYYSNLKREGHTGFIDQIILSDEKCVTVEGNTNDGGGREGDGVHRKFRHIDMIYKIRVFNKPANKELTNVIPNQKMKNAA